jgi:hypothetical protein
MLQESLLATTNCAEIRLSLLKRRHICALAEVWIVDLHRIVFPETYGADEMTARGFIIQCSVPTAGA